MGARAVFDFSLRELEPPLVFRLPVVGVDGPPVHAVRCPSHLFVVSVAPPMILTAFLPTSHASRVRGLGVGLDPDRCGILVGCLSAAACKYTYCERG